MTLLFPRVVHQKRGWKEREVKHWVEQSVTSSSRPSTQRAMRSRSGRLGNVRIRPEVYGFMEGFLGTRN